MGYNTFFSISHIEGNESSYKEVVNELNELSQLDLENGESAHWYDSDADCKAVARKHPDVMFQIDGDGENYNDCWCARYKGDMFEIVSSVIPPFRKLQSEDEKAREASKPDDTLIYYIGPDDAADAGEKKGTDLYHLDRTDIDRLSEDGFGCLMTMQEFIAKFNSDEISDQGYIAKY